MIEKDRKFPQFKVDADLDNFILNVPKKKILFWIENLSNTHYKRNYFFMQEQKEKIDLSDITFRKCFEYYEKAVEYQKNYLILPEKANWFNDHSNAIFEYLEKNEK